MSDKKFLSVFTPSRTPPEDLETIFVQRHALLKDAVERVQESAETGHKHHLLFAGPRGSGKTHLVTLLVHRLSGEKNLDDRLHIAWLNEDETSTTLLELLLKVYGALVKRYPESYQAESLEPAFDLAADAALEFVKKVLLKALGKHTLLIVMENLDALFDGLGDRGQKQLRAFIQEHPVFCIVGTAQTLVNDLTDRSRPFYGFFQTEHMKPLSREEAAELLMNIARHNDQTDVVAFLETARGRARVRALHHLSGGNHRIYIVLSQFITRDNIDSLVAPFQKMVDELTPYYQERIRWLPPQQRKIVEHLCKSEGTVPVKELARQLFASHQTISNQLKDLREKGYIKASQRGRESLYEVTEPLMRICVEVKENQNYEPLRLLVDFVRVWYDDRELDQRLQRYDAKSLARQYLQAAVERNASDGNLRQQLLIDGIREKLSPTLPMGQLEQMCTDLQGSPEELALAVQSLSEGNTEEALELIAPVIDSKNALHRIVALNLRASVFASQGEVQKAIDDYSAVVALDRAPAEQVANALFNRGVRHSQQGEVQKAIDDFSAVVALEGAPAEQVAKALYNRGVAHDQQGEMQKAIDDYSAVVSLEGAPAEQVAKALYNRGVAHGQQGEVQKEIDDYSAVVALEGAPAEQVAKALFNRGVAHGQLDEVQKEIDDYSAVVALEGALAEQVVRALCNRGATHSHQGDVQKAIDDFSAVVALEGVPAEHVAAALYGLGLTFFQMRKMDLAAQSFEQLVGLAGAPSIRKSDAYLTIAEIQCGQGQWEEGFASMAQGVELGASVSPPHIGDIESILALIFDAGLSRGELEKKVSIFSAILGQHSAYGALGESLVHHLGSLTKSDDPPASDQLNRWLAIWEKIADGVPDLIIPMRLFRTGIRYLLSEDRDESVLLDLRFDERELLRQALGLDDGDAKP